MAQKGRVCDHVVLRRPSARFERRPRDARKASIRFASTRGGGLRLKLSSTSPAVSHGSGISRKTTSEKLSPGNFWFLSRLYASSVSAMVVVAIICKHYTDMD